MQIKKCRKIQRGCFSLREIGGFYSETEITIAQYIGMPRAELSAKGAGGKNLGRRSHKLAMDGARVSTAHSSYAGRDWTVRRTRNSTAIW